MPETGVFYGLPDGDYRKLDAINASILKQFRKSPLHAFYAMTQPSLPSKAMQVGSAVHMALLEPDRYVTEQRIGPSNDRRAKAWKDWDQVTQGALKLTPEEAETVEKIRRSVRDKLSTTAFKLLSGKGTNEATAVWCDAETGLHCKARADRITRLDGAPVIVELKTARDAGMRGFSYAVRDFGYDFSAAWYLRGFSLVLPEMPVDVVFVVVETEAPYAVACYKLNAHVLERASEDCHRYLRAYSECLQTRSWGGYPDEIQEIRL